MHQGTAVATRRNHRAQKRESTLGVVRHDDATITRQRARRVRLRHNFDKKHRDITVKTEDWVPLHQEAETALLDQKRKAGRRVNGADLVFRAPRGGIITPGLVNAALAHGCQATNLGYRVTAHGLRHSFATWLKAGVDISVIALWLGHQNTASTDRYLHADMTIKQAAIDRTRPPGVQPGTYTPPPDILAWLNTL